MDAWLSRSVMLDSSNLVGKKYNCQIRGLERTREEEEMSQICNVLRISREQILNYTAILTISTVLFILPV